MGSSLDLLRPWPLFGKEPQGRSSEPWEKIGGTGFSGKETVWFFFFRTVFACSSCKEPAYCKECVSSFFLKEEYDVVGYSPGFDMKNVIPLV